MDSVGEGEGRLYRASLVAQMVKNLSAMQETQVLSLGWDVIKHHQRPSGTQSIQTQLTGSQHSLHSYLSNASGVNFQETSRQSSLSCSPIGESTQVSSGGLQQKPSQVSVELAQSYSSAIPSSGYDGDLSLPLGLALGSPIFPSGCEGKLGVALESPQGRRDLT